jgi:aspartyl-tRNA(Asn)/glutamyl-tRNA(Gln) amidotransferase subunit A
METEACYLTITAALERMRRGSLAPDELAQACMRQIERLNPGLNAFITLSDAISIGQEGSAPCAEAKSGELPLGDIPMGIKDLIETGDMLTTAGSPVFADYRPERDARVVEILRNAGALVLGKTNTHEIALGVTNINPHYGDSHNPWDTSCITGGSSGGSAAAVAAGMCLAALGTDTGGSIRIPASLCGVVGLKASFGRVSLRGVLPLSWNLDHVGPLTRSVKDAALLLEVLAGYDPDDPACCDTPVGEYLKGLEGGIKGWKLALAVGEFMQVSQPEVLSAVQAAAQVMGGLGASVEPVELDWLYDAALANGKIVQADAAAVYREKLEQQPESFGADVRQRLETGLATPSSEYIRARRLQAEFRRASELFFREYDALLLPSTPIPAIPIEGIENSASQAPTLTRFTAPFNLTGLPALSLPCGFSSNGLPIGLQIVCGPWQEARLLRAGYAYERATDWHACRPPLAS